MVITLRMQCTVCRKCKDDKALLEPKASYIRVWLYLCASDERDNWNSFLNSNADVDRVRKLRLKSSTILLRQLGNYWHTNECPFLRFFNRLLVLRKKYFVYGETTYSSWYSFDSFTQKSGPQAMLVRPVIISTTFKFWINVLLTF